MLDGRLVVGRQSRPSTLLRVPSVVDIGTDRVTEVIAAVRAAGLPDVTTEVDDAAADPMYGTSRGTYWTFHYADKAGDHELAVFSLDTAIQILPDEKYVTLYDLYFQLATWAGEAPELGKLPVERIELMVVASVEAGSVTGFDPAPWPLDQAVAELPEYTSGIRCTVATGPEVAGLHDLLTSLAVDTPFAQGDRWYGVMARALVPGEPGCRLPAAQPRRRQRFPAEPRHQMPALLPTSQASIGRRALRGNIEHYIQRSTHALRTALVGANRGHVTKGSFVRRNY
jgi:hypothetical protein